MVTLIIVAIVFLIVEIVSMIIGVSMTRTITGAVHRLYEGTQKVMEGDFSHRIEVKGKDQLADLSESFNRMTENLERLLVVAKEKERLQSEIEIAREVQSQLYPRVVPQTRTLRLTAVCHPARMCLRRLLRLRSDSRLPGGARHRRRGGQGNFRGAVDGYVAEFAAHRSCRARSRSRPRLETAAGATRCCLCCRPRTWCRASTISFTRTRRLRSTRLSASASSTNRPGMFTYTNAGHLPPLLVRDGVAERLDVNGTVVGAFPFC